MSTAKGWISAAVAAWLLLGGSAAPGAGKGKEPPGVNAPQRFYDITVRDIDGKEVSLSRYRGQVCLIVNVASR